MDMHEHSWESTGIHGPRLDAHVNAHGTEVQRECYEFQATLEAYAALEPSDTAARTQALTSQKGFTAAAWRSQT